ncbi:MAG TPA: hypothetical protein VMT52_04565, partial [Planctomycetota bacterium]|nr:hypothetical protein [Planctomycetota bacterium]
ALAKVWVPPTAKAFQETPEAARAYEAQLQEAKKLYSEGKLAAARDRLILDFHFHKTHQEEIRQYQDQWEKEYVAKWEVDKAQADRLARGGKPDEAVQVLRGAHLYGDEQIRKEANRMEETIQAQVALQGGTRESGAQDEENLEEAFEKSARDEENQDEPPEDESTGEPEAGGTEETPDGEGE